MPVSSTAKRGGIYLSVLFLLGIVCLGVDKDVIGVGKLNNVTRRVGFEMEASSRVINNLRRSDGTGTQDKCETFLCSPGGLEIAALLDRDVQVEWNRFDGKLPGFDFGEVQDSSSDGLQGIGRRTCHTGDTVRRSTYLLACAGSVPGL